jgi:hypothetical protein
MKTLCLKIDESLYEILLSMLKGLPEQKIKIIESSRKSLPNPSEVPRAFDVMKYAGKIQWPADGVAYQRAVRDEEW